MSWLTHNTGYFNLEVPTDWVAEQPLAGSLVLQDPQSQVVLAFTAIARPQPGPAPHAANFEVQRELEKWLQSQDHIRNAQASRLLAEARYPTAITECLQPFSIKPIPWYRRFLQGHALMHWRFWAILNPHLLLLVSCNGRPVQVERHRETVDRIVASVQLPTRSLLLGRNFTETVVSLARTWFPQTAVAIVDDAHLQFGNQSISLQNLHRCYLASPDDLPTHVRSFFTTLQEQLPASTIADSWTHARDRVYPVLLTSIAVHNAPTRIQCEPWINDLNIGYVLADIAAAPGSLGKSSNDRYIAQEDVARWGISGEVLHDQALHNLVVCSHDYTMQGQKADGFTMLSLGSGGQAAMEAAGQGGGAARRVEGSSGDRHNAARILLPELHRKLREHLGTTFYAALPTRGLLLAFATGDDDVLVRIRQQVTSDYQRAPAHMALSPKLFLVTPDGIAGDPHEQEDLLS